MNVHFQLSVSVITTSHSYHYSQSQWIQNKQRNRENRGGRENGQTHSPSRYISYRVIFITFTNIFLLPKDTSIMHLISLHPLSHFKHEMEWAFCSITTFCSPTSCFPPSLEMWDRRGSLSNCCSNHLPPFPSLSQNVTQWNHVSSAVLYCNVREVFNRLYHSHSNTR